MSEEDMPSDEDQSLMGKEQSRRKLLAGAAS